MVLLLVALYVKMDTKLHLEIDSKSGTFLDVYSRVESLNDGGGKKEVLEMR